MAGGVILGAGVHGPDQHDESGAEREGMVHPGSLEAGRAAQNIELLAHVHGPW